MNRIIEKRDLSENVVQMVLEAPAIARKRKAGQFVILKMDEKGERIPLTIVDSDATAGTLTIIFQVVGKSTAALAKMKAGQSLTDLQGPLGNPTEIENYGRVVCIGGGIGVAPVHPIACAHKAIGNRVISIMGARSKELLIMEGEMAKASDELIITTDDGSYGKKGFVTQALEEIILREGKENISLTVAIGPVPMMRFCCKVTEKYEVKTEVSLNPIMVDATGMCGACRVTVGGETKFACVDGPEFDGHKVNFDELTKRLAMYKSHEAVSMEKHLHEHHGGKRCWE